MLQRALLVVAVVTPTVGSRSRTCAESVAASCDGTFFLQVRASTLQGMPAKQVGAPMGQPALAKQVLPKDAQPPGVALASQQKDIIGPDIPSKVLEVVAQAAVGSKVEGIDDSADLHGDNMSDGKNEFLHNTSLRKNVGNRSLEDVIKEAQAQTLTNRTAAKDGARALTRKKEGRRTEKEQKFEKTVEEDVPNSTIADELNNQTIQEVIRDRVEEAVNAEVVDKVTSEHRLPSQGELNSTVREELREIWNDLLYARRHRKGFEQDVNIWSSMVFFDWCLMLLALAVFVGVSFLLRDWPSTRSLHGGALLIWFILAGLYNAMIYARLGSSPAMSWLVGYLLELIFSIENLFVYHIIVKAFRMPRWVMQRMLLIIVLFQLVFQFVFYMGLAAWLRSLQVLPYILGVWLIYLGCQAVLEEESKDFDVMQTCAVSRLKLLLGERLILDHDDSGALLSCRGGKLCLCPPGLLLLCLLVADFLLEVDVTVTKIEGFPSRYLCFSSSMVATFALPELFFVARDLFARFSALKYGIGFILLFVGGQALMHDFFTLTAVNSLAVIVGVIVMSVLVSVMFGLGKGDIATEFPPPGSAGSEPDNARGEVDER